MIGQIISHYKILEKLGEGGMGVVYKAEDTKLKRTVALKFLPHHLLANEEDKTRFLHEAQAASALSHSNIMTIHEIDEVEDETFIAMEYLEGETLKDKLEKGPLRTKELLNTAIGVADGLAAAHEKGIIHRDIKSENLMISKGGLVKIMDFGLARRKGETRITKTGSTLGTLAYMSPEQAEGLEVDRRSDLFSFGVVMYEMATGQLPFKGEHDAAILYAIVNEAPLPVTTLNPNIPQELDRIVHKALEKEVEERYQHADDLAADLKKLKKDIESRKTIKAIKAPGEVVTGKGVVAGRRKKILVGAGIAAVILLAGLWRVLDIGTFMGGPSEVKMDLGKPAGRPMIAVLPFTPMSLGEDISYLADGMTEAIINELAKVRGLRVASRTSVMRYKGTTKDIREIGKALGVNTVLEGSVQLAANRLRVTAQLVDVSEGFHLWSDNYDRDYEDIFVVQDDVALNITQALKVELTPGEEEALKAKPEESVRAYDYYLKGREYYFRYRKEEMQYAIQMFKKAIEIDSNYALAYAGLGDAYAQMVNRFGWSEAWLDTSIAMSRKALNFDKESAEAYKALGLAYGTAGELEKAIDANLEALKWNPSYWMAAGNLGWYNLEIGRYEEARKWSKRQLEIDPMTPFSHLLSGSIYEVSGNYRLAEKEYERAVDLQPDFTLAMLTLGWLYTLQGRMDEGKKYVQKSLELDRSGGTLTGLAQAYLVEGEYDRAASLFEESRLISGHLDYESDVGLGFIAAKNENIEDARKHLSGALNKVEELLNRSPQAVSAKFAMAEIYSIKNEPEASLRWLREVTDTGYRNYLRLETDPYLENIRSDSEFKLLLERMRRD